MKKIYFVLLSVLIVTFAFGEADQNGAVQKTAYTCPAPGSLIKKDLIWGTPDGWVSYGESFDTKIVSFQRADWVGVNVGKIICIYKGDKKLGFPIALEKKYQEMVLSPTGNAWGPPDANGSKQCVSSDIKDCPFIVKKIQEPKNIYDDLDFYKGKEGLDE